MSRLLHPKNAKVLRSWVKAPDTGFYEIEYAYQEGGVGRSKRGKFNPDFFLYRKDANLIVVAEVKADSDDSWKNKGKTIAARAHFKTINEMLQEAGEERRYSFHIVSPKDYDRFFEALREGKLDSFVSTLQGQLDAKKLNGRK